MQFNDLAIGDKFIFKGEECMKTQVQKLSCCKIKRNACIIEGNKDLILNGNEQVDKVENE